VFKTGPLSPAGLGPGQVARSASTGRRGQRRSIGKTNTIPSAAQAPSLPLEAASPPSLAPGAFPAGSRYVMSDAEAAVVAVRARHSQKFSDTGISRALRWRPPGAGRLSKPRPPLPGFVSARRRRCRPLRGGRRRASGGMGEIASTADIGTDCKTLLAMYSRPCVVDVDGRQPAFDPGPFADGWLVPSAKRYQARRSDLDLTR
jgi:hypothetical protein